MNAYGTAPRALSPAPIIGSQIQQSPDKYSIIRILVSHRALATRRDERLAGVYFPSPRRGEDVRRIGYHEFRLPARGGRRYTRGKVPPPRWGEERHPSITCDERATPAKFLLSPASVYPSQYAAFVAAPGRLCRRRRPPTWRGPTIRLILTRYSRQAKSTSVGSIRPPIRTMDLRR